MLMARVGWMGGQCTLLNRDTINEERQPASNPDDKFPYTQTSNHDGDVSCRLCFCGVFLLSARTCRGKTDEDLERVVDHPLLMSALHKRSDAKTTYLETSQSTNHDNPDRKTIP
jgi:hypothetical protein